MTLDLTDDEAVLLLKELNDLIDGDRIRTLKAIRAKIRPEPAREPPPPPPKRYAPPRASAAKRRGARAQACSPRGYPFRHVALDVLGRNHHPRPRGQRSRSE